MHRIARILVLAVLVLPALGLIGPATALGQNDPGGDVTVDPNSPSGTEYDIPVERARRETEGKQKKSVTPGDQSSPLFGQGVESQATPSAPSPATGPTAAEKAKAKKAAAKKARAKAQRKAAEARKRKERAAKKAAAAAAAAKRKAKADQNRITAERVASEGGGSAPSAAAALGAGVLLIAGLGGWLLRRRPR